MSLATLYDQLSAAVELEADEATRKPILELLKTAIANLQRLELSQFVETIKLEPLFECLGSSDEEQIEVVCGILRSFMPALGASDCLVRYHHFILQGFHHPDSSVRALVIAQLQRCVDSSNETVELLCSEYQDLIIATINQLNFDDLNASKESGILLHNLARNPIGQKFLLSDPGIGTMKNILNSSRTSETIKFRVYETLIRFSNISPECLQRIDEQIGLIDGLSEISFDSSDVLGQLNALEILSNLSETKFGIEYLERKEFFTKLLRLVNDLDSDPLSGTLVFPGALKFIGKVGVQKLPLEPLVQVVMATIQKKTDDFALATVGVETLCFIGTTDEGKVYLDQREDFKACLRKIRGFLNESPTEFRCRILDALALLFDSGEQNQEFLPKWFVIVFPQISVLFSLVQQPFPDIRLGSLHFLKAIAHLEWAQKHYLRIPGVLEFLLNRSLEPNTDCIISKFGIVKIIAESPYAGKILREEDIGKLKIHVEQGPFYAEAGATVALDGA